MGEKDIRISLKETGRDITATFDKIKIIELKYVFLIGVPVFVKKDSESGKILAEYIERKKSVNPIVLKTWLADFFKGLPDK